MFGLDKSKYTEEDIKNALAASFAEMLNEMDADERAQMMESLASVNEGLIHRFEYQVPLKRQSGERIWVEVSTSPFQYKGEMVELSFMRDISARKRRGSSQST
jgi:PAS domain S-box-containing protein